jgi:hypothetical protein
MVSNEVMLLTVGSGSDRLSSPRVESHHDGVVNLATSSMPTAPAEEPAVAPPVAPPVKPEPVSPPMTPFHPPKPSEQPDRLPCFDPETDLPACVR